MGKFSSLGILVFLALGNGILVEAITPELVSSIGVSGPLNLSIDSKTHADTGSAYDFYTITAKTINDTGGGGWSSTASGLVTGGQAYSELRAGATGTYISEGNQTNTNMTVLDTALSKVGNTEVVASADNDSLSVERTQTTDANGITTTTYDIKAKEATLATGDTGLVTGGDAYDELRSGADGTKISSTSSTAANLTALDDQVKSNAGQIEINQKDIQDLRDMKNLTEEGKTYIKNLAKESVKVQSGNEAIFNVTKTDVGGVDTYTITAKTGEIGQGLETLVTGGKVYEQVHLTADGNYIKQSNSTAQNISALDDQVKTNSNLIIDIDKRAGNEIECLFEEFAQVGAGAAALSALRPEGYDPDNRWSFALGYGRYENRNAGAVGIFFKPDINMTFSAGGTVWSGEPMWNFGASFRRKRVAGSHHMTQELVYRILALETRDKKQSETLATQIKRIEKAENIGVITVKRITYLEAVNQKLKEENQIQAEGIVAKAKEIAELKSGVETLREDNEELEADNEMLRRLIDTILLKCKAKEKLEKNL